MMEFYGGYTRSLKNKQNLQTDFLEYPLLIVNFALFQQTPSNQHMVCMKNGTTRTNLILITPMSLAQHLHQNFVSLFTYSWT